MTVQTTATNPAGATPAMTTTLTVPSFRRLVWLIPVAYALHIVEELVGNFPGWVTHSVGGSFSSLAFVLNNIAFMIIVLTLVTVYTRRPTARKAFVLLVWTSANLFWDALFHLIMTPVLGVYSPGLVTAMLLYLPLCLLLAAVVVHQRILSVQRLAGAAVAGLAVFGFVVWYGLFHFAV